MKKNYPEAKILGRIESDNALVIKLFAEARENSLHSLEIKRRCLEHAGKILLVLAQNEESLAKLDGISGYIYERDIKVPLNVRIGITLDRLLGKR